MGHLKDMLESGQAPHFKGARLITTDEQTMKTMAKMEERGDFARSSQKEKNFLKKVWTTEMPGSPKTAGAPNLI